MLQNTKSGHRKEITPPATYILAKPTQSDIIRCPSEPLLDVFKDGRYSGLSDERRIFENEYDSIRIQAVD